jgi:hypothetical protein
MKISQTLNNPYPQILNKWRVIYLISIFISFFMLVFQPFGLQYLRIEFKPLLLAGYGLVTMIVLIFNLILLPKILPKIFDEETWTARKQIVWLLWIVISISVGNYFYSILFSIFAWIGIKGIVTFMVFTLSIAIIPITAVTFISYNVILRRNIVSSNQINTQINARGKKEEDPFVELEIFSGNQKYKFKPEDVVFIESEGNYINIHYLLDKKVKSQMIRSTIKNIESEIPNDQLLKCHRAFIVNPHFIEKVKGNSQGYNLVLSHISEEIPVARSFTKTFRERMANIA